MIDDNKERLKNLVWFGDITNLVRVKIPGIQDPFGLVEDIYQITKKEWKK